MNSEVIETKGDIEMDIQSQEMSSKIMDHSLFSRREHKILLAAILVQAFCYSFEVNLMCSCLGYVTAVFEVTSLFSSLPVILEIIAAALVPFCTKISDVVGRYFQDLPQFALDQISYGIGSTGMMTLTQVLIADATLLINRSIMFALWDMPDVVNVFASQALTDPLTIVPGANWRNVYIISGVVAGLGALILLTPLWHLLKKTVKRGNKAERKSFSWLLQEYDVMGALILTLGLNLTLLPMIVAKRFEDNWKNPIVLAMLFSGIVSLLLLTVWEIKFSKRPIMPMRIWVNCTCFGALAIGCFLTVMNAINYQYYTLYLVVSRNLTYGDAILLERGYQVAYPVFELITGLLMRRFNTFRPFIWIGIIIATIGLGLQIPAHHPISSDAFVVISQAIVGGAADMANVAASVAVAGAVSKADVATAIGVTQLLGSFDYAFGGALSGGIWTQYLSERLAKHITREYDEVLAMNNPLKYILNLDPVTKCQFIEAYADSQKLMLIIAMSLAVLVCLVTATMKHIDLRWDQTNALDHDEHPTNSRSLGKRPSLNMVHSRSTNHRRI
ncbi:hypothetical protein BGX33_009059 [Mortierella sp. NVP41]|nr:hypothetical protein BGX33_009059 [Mortierella sp. NVP41]